MNIVPYVFIYFYLYIFIYLFFLFIIFSFMFAVYKLNFDVSEDTYTKYIYLDNFITTRK